MSISKDKPVQHPADTPPKKSAELDDLVKKILEKIKENCHVTYLSLLDADPDEEDE